MHGASLGDRAVKALGPMLGFLHGALSGAENPGPYPGQKKPAVGRAFGVVMFFGAAQCAAATLTLVAASARF
jgi:hypothetical protein